MKSTNRLLSRTGLYDVPAGKVVSVVTHLEMRERPPPRDPPPNDDLGLRKVDAPPLGWYRKLFERVGGDWMWFSRLVMADADLAAIIHDPAVDVFVLSSKGVDHGLLELDRREAPDVELAFFGLSADLVGRGAGRWLMERALEIAFAEPLERLHLHTCTLDHPSALAFYQRSGFVPYARSIEIADDPRLRGTLPAAAAAHYPPISPA